MITKVNPYQQATSFGSIYAEPKEKNKVSNYLWKNINSPEETTALNKLIESQKQNSADIYLSTIKSSSLEEKLCAKIGGQEFSSTKPLEAIKSAVKVANKIYNEKLKYQTINEGLSKVIEKLSSVK